MKHSLFKSLTILCCAVMLFSCQQPQQKEQEQQQQTDTAALKKEVNVFIDQWHKDASNADLEYFNKIADGGIFIGTDKTENWTKSAFQAWAKKFFDKGKAWSFTAQKRNIYFSDDGNYGWFDEVLKTQMGDCQASGVVQHVNNGWKIKHYQLSLAIPNGVQHTVTKIISDYEQEK